MLLVHHLLFMMRGAVGSLLMGALAVVDLALGFVVCFVVCLCVYGCMNRLTVLL